MAATDVRHYRASARSTDTYGRVVAAARHNHFVVDGPVENGCPGEAVTPGELFLAGVATCGVELIEVIGRGQGVEVGGVAVEIEGVVDRSNPVRPDVTVFNSVRLRFELTGVDQDQARTLVEAFKGR
jgi:uncharacterized OsmC-like protein